MTVPTRHGHHLSIGEVLSSLQDEFPDITVSKIRFLESQGLIDPERTPSGYRRFYPPDVERLRWILYQQREHFLPLRVIKDRLDRYGPTGAPALGSTNGDSAAVTADERPPRPREVPAPRRPRRPEPALTLPLDGLTDADDDRPFVSTPERKPDARAPDRREPGGALPRPEPDVHDAGVGERTRAEVREEAGISDDALTELETFGLLAPVAGAGASARYDDDALAIARAAAPFFARAVGGRHLRMYQHFAEREAELFSQVLLQYRRQRNPAAQARLEADLQELARAGSRLRALVLRRAVRDALRE